MQFLYEISKFRRNSQLSIEPTVSEAEYLMCQGQKPSQRGQVQLKNVVNETQRLALLIQFQYVIHLLDLKTRK